MFKKINEGLETFDTYHERHENSTNPSQRDKLESDLKREIKKLQKLREQIKVWQTQNEVKDKDKLLDYRRLVETAMEKYKVVEKGSKVKAYSNMSLKQGADLDPEEKEKLDTINFLQESIDDIERQYQTAEVEIEKLTGKKSKKNSSANESKRDELKELQSTYRWHQQQLELALRLLENDELQVSDILEIKEDLIYFLQSNRDPNFIDNEYIYESLDLDSNELLSNEVVSSFNGLSVQDENKPVEDKKEQSQSPKPISTSVSTSEKASPAPTSAPNLSGLPSALPVNTISSVPAAAKKIETPKSKRSIVPPASTGTVSSNPSTPTTLSSTLKPAAAPPQPPSAMKWSLLASGGLLNNTNGNGASNNNHNETSDNATPVPPNTAPAQITTGSTLTTEVPITPTKTPPQTSIPVPPSSFAGTISQLSGSSVVQGAPSSTILERPISSPSVVNGSEISINQITNGAVAAAVTTSVGDNVATETTRSSISNNTSPISQIDFQQDAQLLLNPPGINDLIGSYVSSRTSANIGEAPRYLSNVRDLLTLPREHFDIPTGPSPATILETQRVYQLYSQALHLMDPDNYKTILPNMENSVLFYGYFYGVTPFENSMIGEELQRRNWRSDHSRRFWFQRKPTANVIRDHPDFEISNYLKFEVDDWSFGELNAFKLYYRDLADFPAKNQ